MAAGKKGISHVMKGFWWVSEILLFGSLTLFLFLVLFCGFVLNDREESLFGGSGKSFIFLGHSCRAAERFCGWKILVKLSKIKFYLKTIYLFIHSIV